MTPPRVLVAGVGNIFLGDDAFGVAVVRRLAGRPLPDGVQVIDFGIRGIDLAYAMLDGYDAIILVDAVPRGGEPGTLYVIEPHDGGEPAGPDALVATHDMDPVKVLRLVRALGGRPAWLRLVGCEPATLEPGEEALALSPPVQAAVDGAVGLIESLIGEFIRDTEHRCTS
ncbi:MAG TPA: hydrogenase maturation protease [Gemmataceae bacterium]|nr:hydrogenase maturation protease [Gemmataceae bacterium]